MARIVKDNKLNVVVGRKSQIENDPNIPEGALVFVTDEVPTTANIQDTPNKRFVTDQQIAAWNAGAGMTMDIIFFDGAGGMDSSTFVLPSFDYKMVHIGFRYGTLSIALYPQYYLLYHWLTGGTINPSAVLYRGNFTVPAYLADENNVSTTIFRLVEVEILGNGKLKVIKDGNQMALGYTDFLTIDYIFGYK